MKEKLRVSIKYSGKSVNDGSMELSHTLAALGGFSTAYTKLAFQKKVDVRHEIRLVGLHQGSADFVLQVITGLGNHKDVLAGVGAGLVILKTVLEIVKLTKHSKGEEMKAVPDLNGNIIVSNSENVTINVSKDTYQIFQEGTIRQDLSKLAEPLDTGRIDALQISAKDKRETAKEEIKSTDKPFFGYIPAEIAETKEMTLEGRLFSVNTEINRGSLRLPNGDRVGYRFKSDHPEKFYPHVLRKGLVRVKCIAHLDENLKPVHIDILDVVALDPDLPFK